MNKILTLNHDPIMGSSFNLVDANSNLHPNIEVIIPLEIPDADGDVMTQEELQDSIDKTEASNFIVAITSSENPNYAKITIKKNKQGKE